MIDEKQEAYIDKVLGVINTLNITKIKVVPFDREVLSFYIPDNKIISKSYKHWNYDSEEQYYDDLQREVNSLYEITCNKTPKLPIGSIFGYIGFKVAYSKNKPKILIAPINEEFFDSEYKHIIYKSLKNIIEC